VYVKFTLQQITVEDAEAEPESDRLFGPSYDDRQRALWRARQEAQQAPIVDTLVAMPGEKRSTRRWPDASALRGKRVSIDLELIDDAYRDLVGDTMLSTPGTVKQVMNGFARIAWGPTQAWLTIDALTLIVP